MSIKVKLSLICFFFIAIIAAISIVGYQGSKNLTRSLKNVAAVQLLDTKSNLALKNQEDPWEKI
ncbi:MAG: hypothetical protein ACOYOK_02220 [Pseudobdellovibrionaceae bacterium]